MTRIQNKTILMISGVLLLLALFLHFFFMNLMKDGLLITTTLVSGFPIGKMAWQSTRMKTFSIELLVIIAVIGALFIREYLESAVVTFLFLFGAYLEARALEKTRSSLKSLIDMSPLEATVLREGELVTISVDEVLEGDHVVIQSGEKIAIDGRIISGQAFIHESAITGESVPVKKSVNGHVFSGTILDNGYIEVVAEKVGEDTTFSKIIELVEEAQESKAKTQKYLEKFANYYTPSIILLSVIVFVVTRDLRMTLTFLVIACPGALVISAPVSIVAGIGNGAKKGVLIKGGDIMERFSKIDVIAFDKTGTLTKGKPEIIEIKTYGMDEVDVLRLAAEAETISEHPIGQTIVKEALSKRLALDNKPSRFEIAKGHGIKATIHEKSLVIGNRKWLRDNFIEITQMVESDAKAREEKGCTGVFVAIDSRLVGVIYIGDEIRPEMKHSLSLLNKEGIKRTIMLTGDNPSSALKIANQLGIQEIYAEMLPEGKMEKIKELKALGYHVAMIGDGINDAPAIASANIGIAMGSVGADVAMETANVVLMADRLDKLPFAYELSKATIRNMKQNMFLAVATVIFLLVGVLTQNIFLASGMFIHEISVLFVILNALRLVNFRHPGARRPTWAKVIKQAL
jgi:Zn2+/Cd2+-exporting ATPase